MKRSPPPNAATATGDPLQSADDRPGKATTDRAGWLRHSFEQHQPVLLLYALKLTRGDSDRAEEAVQETFLRLCRQRQVDIQGHERAWLFKVCRNRIIDMQRTNHSQARHEVGADQGRRSPIESPPTIEPPDARLERNEESLRLRQLIEELPDRQRELLHLKIHGQLSYREMAVTTGISVSNVGYLLHQALRSLRDKLKADSTSF